MRETEETLVSKAEYRTTADWLRAFEKGGPAQPALGRIYGNDSGIVEHRRARIFGVLAEAARIYGVDRQVAVVRCPSRINLRGMHSEMQHASPNYLSHGREIIMVVEKRVDDQVVIHNANAQRFDPRFFHISEEMAGGPWGDWVEYIGSESVRKRVEAARGDWSNYVKAAVLALQDHLPGQRLAGMNLMTSGDIPLVGGMSSSSAMVVASGLACMAANGLEISRKELVILFGEGEWYVGTRGGFGDHGAMLLGKYGCIVHTPFVSVEELEPVYIDFPEDHQIVIVNSYKTSAKSGEQLFNYNQTIFGYGIALSLIKDVLVEMDEATETIEEIAYLGQITPEAFGLEKIYRILRALPERVSVEELKTRYPDLIQERLARFFGQLSRYPDYLNVRGPALWGIAESERSRGFARLVQQGKMTDAGELMYIGQDGDRLFEFSDNGEPREYTANLVSDHYLDGLLADLASGDSERVAQAQLARQPGCYNCSSLELDRIVEILRRTPGVRGASLTGAGFGGIVLAIAQKDEDGLNALRNALIENYYEVQEKEELGWVLNSTELADALGASEAGKMSEKLQEIVTRKQAGKGAMTEDDAAAANGARHRINTLFVEGKVPREMAFIPADYYVEGVVRHIPVAGAGSVALAQD